MREMQRAKLRSLIIPAVLTVAQVALPVLNVRMREDSCMELRMSASLTNIRGG